MASSTVDVWSISLAPAYCVVIAEYSLLEALEGTGCPVVAHIGLDTRVFSPRSVRAMMLRVFDVVPVLLVTHTSTRFIFIPEVRLGSERIHSS